MSFEPLSKSGFENSILVEVDPGVALKGQALLGSDVVVVDSVVDVVVPASSNGVESEMDGETVVVVVVPTVPSLRHSSRPFTPSVAMKRRVEPNLARPVGVDPVEPGLKSVTMTVPASVPSDFQSSAPFVPSSAEKKRVELTTVEYPMLGLVEDGCMSFTN